MVECVKKWKVDTRDHLSDHKRITYGLDLEVEAYTRVWITMKADWPRFSALMRDKSNDFIPHRYWSQATLDREIKFFYEDLNSCVSKVCHKTLAKRIFKKNSWWSNELSLQRREVRRLQQQIMR